MDVSLDHCTPGAQDASRFSQGLQPGPSSWPRPDAHWSKWPYALCPPYCLLTWFSWSKCLPALRLLVLQRLLTRAPLLCLHQNPKNLIPTYFCQPNPSLSTFLSVLSHTYFICCCLKSQAQAGPRPPLFRLLFPLPGFLLLHTSHCQSSSSSSPPRSTRRLFLYSGGGPSLPAPIYWLILLSILSRKFT